MDVEKNSIPAMYAWLTQKRLMRNDQVESRTYDDRKEYWEGKLAATEDVLRYMHLAFDELKEGEV